MANDYELTQPPPSPLEASDADRLEMSQEATQSGADPSNGPLSSDMVDKADTQIGDLRNSSDTEYNTALAQQQQIANQARDALRAARERLTNEKPDRSAMWLAVAGALGQPSYGRGTMAGIANAAATASPFMAQEDQDKHIRESNIDRLGLTLSEYGTGKDAFDPDLINTHLAQSKLKQMLANQMEVAMLRRGKGSTANPLSGATELAKLNAEMDGLDPNDPNFATKKKEYQDKIRLLTTREPNQTAVMMDAMKDPTTQSLLWELTRLGVPMPQGYGRGPMMVSLLNAALKDPKNQGKTPEQIAREMAAGQQDWKAAMASLSQAGRTAGNVSFAVNELEQTIPLARAASMKVPRGTFVPLGQLFQWGARLNSNPALKDFAIKNQGVLNAYDMFAKRGGTDVGKREMLHNNLVTAESQQAYEVALKAIEQEMHAAKRAGQNSMKSEFDTTPPDMGPPDGEVPKTKTVNGQVWTLHIDAKQRKAYVSPDGKQFQVVH